MLRGRMDAAGIPLARVHSIVVTHSHPDHFGGAGLLAEESGGAIVASDRFRTFFDPEDIDDRELEAADDIDPDESPIPSIRIERPAPWGGSTIGPPPEARAKMLAHQADFFRWFKPPRPSRRVADSDHIALGGRDWVGLFTPGHTDDHLCLYDEEGGVLLSGDQVLPTITPHISGLIPEIRFFSTPIRSTVSRPAVCLDRAAGARPAVPRLGRQGHRDQAPPRRPLGPADRDL